MGDPYNLQRFVDAQNPVYDQVLRELHQQRKTTHWIWFIFPQLQGLGSSHMSQRFAISSLDEATAYLAHPILGPRLFECTQLLLAARDKTILQILGSPDNMKFHSSMTIFSRAANTNQIYKDAINLHFDGKPDNLTLRLLAT